MTSPAPPSALADLRALQPSSGRGIYGSGGELFRDAIFGRDSAEAADALAHLRPELARGVIASLAGLQGLVDAPIGPHSNEEEPGKIHHEHRSLYVDGRRISRRSEELLESLAARWGGDSTGMTYYGSVDATALFVRLVDRFRGIYGPEILDTQIVQRDGRRVTVRDAVDAAVAWIERRVDESSLGLLEMQRRNPDGIQFQVWKDSQTSYIHLDSTLANWDAPIAVLEVQAYCRDALVAAGHHERARQLRDRMLETMWMPSESYFAMGLDRDPQGHPRLIESVASNAALLLDTGVFNDLPDADQYIEAIARRICGPDFLTDAGIRCRSLAERDLTDFWDYHGAFVVWAKETFDAVRGLHRQGLVRTARQLGLRLLNAVNLAGAHAEFFYVGADGRPMYDLRGADPLSARPVAIAGTNYPEAPQAWTVSAALSLKCWLAGAHPLGPQAPQAAARARLDEAVASTMPRREPLGTRPERAAEYARRGDYVVDTALGYERDQAAVGRRAGRPT